MKEIKFTTNYEAVLSFSDKDFKRKYEERIGNNPNYTQAIDGDVKHLAICPRCNNPVVILGIYKKINVSPHARHVNSINIPNVTQFSQYKLERCPYYNKKANYVKEYVPETEETQRQELYRIAKENYDKAIYLLQKETGIHMNLDMAKKLAENYVIMRAYNYIDATIYNIPWYLIYCFSGFPLYHMIVKKGTVLHTHLLQLGLILRKSKIDGHVYIESNEGYLLRATDYRYYVDKNDNLKERLDFSILRPDKDVSNTLLYTMVDRFSIDVDSYYFGNLIKYENWNTQKPLLDIAEKCMNP